MAELEAQLNNLTLDEPSLLDASDAQEIMQCAAKAKDEVLVIVLVGLCGAGKSAKSVSSVGVGRFRNGSAFVDA